MPFTTFSAEGQIRRHGAEIHFRLNVKIRNYS